MSLVDTFGRTHDNLRISVTDRCNIRCFYCMPETGVTFVPKREILSFEEIERFVRVAAGLGVRKLRLTGGEPLLRRDLPVLVEKLVRVPGSKISRLRRMACCWPSRRGLCSTRDSGASTCTSTRSIENGSGRSRGATISRG
jgi:L-lysine 2,3-aminomutase